MNQLGRVSLALAVLFLGGCSSNRDAQPLTELLSALANEQAKIRIKNPEEFTGQEAGIRAAALHHRDDVKVIDGFLGSAALSPPAKDAVVELRRASNAFAEYYESLVATEHFDLTQDDQDRVLELLADWRAQLARVERRRLGGE